MEVKSVEQQLLQHALSQITAGQLWADLETACYAYALTLLARHCRQAR